MKKLLSLILVIGLVLSIAGSAFASSVPRRFDKKLSTYVATGVDGTITPTAVPTTTITTDDRIHGFCVQAISATAGANVGLYDQTSTALALANLIQEAEVTLTVPFVQVWYDYPIRVDAQLQILIGTGGGVVTIFYDDVSERY